MHKKENRAFLRYGVALVSVAVATLIRFLLSSLLGDSVPFIFYFPAVAASGWYGGFWPGLFSTGVSAVAAWFLFVPSLHSNAGWEWSAPARLAVFLLGCIFINVVIESLRRASQKAIEGRRREREERERLRVTLASIGDAVIATDVQGRVTFLNGVAEALTGWRQADAVGKEINEVFCIVNEHTRKKVESPLARVLREGAIVGLANHTVLIARDGTGKPIADSGAPIKDDSGETIGAVLVFRDITTSREAEVTMSRLAAIVESSDDAIIGKNLEGVITSWNQAAERIFGYTAAEAVGQPIHIIIPPERRAEEGRILERLRKGEPIEHYETVRQRKDSALIDVSLAISPIKDGEGTIIGASKIARDITAQKHAEGLLREASILNEKILGSITDGFYLFDKEFRYRYVNQAGMEIAGFTREELLGRKISEVYPNPEGEMVEREFARALRENVPVQFEIYYPAVDRWFEIRGYPSAGGLTSYIAEITERKRLEKSLRVSEERLRLSHQVTGVGNWEWNSMRNEVFWSPEYRAIYGLDANDIPSFEKGMAVVVEEDREAIRRAILHALKSGEEFTSEHRISHPQKGLRWIQSIGRAVNDEQQTPVRMIGLVRDVTVRKQAEQEVREGAERLRLALEAAELGDWSWEASTGVVTLSARAAEILGVQEKKMPWSEIRKLLHIGDHERASRAVQQAFATNSHFDIEYRVLRAGGRLIWVAAKGQAIYNEAGQVERILGVVQDITDQKQAELLLREQEERHRLALEAGQIGTWDWDIVQNHVVWSDLVYKFHGLKPGEFGGKVEDFAEIVHPDDRDRVSAAINAALENKDPYSIETRLVWPNGEVHWIATKGKVFFDDLGKPVRMIGATVEITASRQAEERQRLLWEAAGVLLTSDNPEAMLQGIFSQVGRQIGIDTYFNYIVEEDKETLRLKSYAGILPEEAEKMGRLKFGQAVCGNVALGRVPIAASSIQESDDPMVQFVKAYGIRAYACNPLLARDQLIGTLAFASHAKESFSEVELEFFETISRYVTVAYERLRLIEQLQEADKRKDEFLAMLAHELRNPLAPVRNAVGLLKHYAANDPKLQWPREVIDRQVTHMTRLVDDLLDVSRITRGKIELRHEIVEMASIVERALETSRPLVDAKRQQLTVTLPAEPIRVTGDATRLAQILSNLLSNAAKYTDAGGGIQLSVERKGDEIITRVCDNGMGILPDMLPHIFDLFAQADGSLDRSQGGLGIGLTVVKALAEMHGGRVVARSEGPNKGSEFTVYLPALIETPSEQVSATAKPAAPESAQGCRILVVDDNVDSAESMALLLHFEGHEVKTAFDGLEALQAAREYKPNVVLLDIGLPGMDGYEVARELRQDGEHHRVVLIALTGYGQAEDRQRSQEAGFDHHLTKPVDHDLLNSLIKSLMFR
jgi:PAS domain S-box-containing protein